LKEAAQLWDDAFDERPRIDKGQVSITDLELYWLLSNPAWLKKTTFYRKGRPIPNDQVNAIIRQLLPPKARNLMPI
jgi:hypothetical protein